MTTSLSTRIEIIRGNITEQAVDAIINSTNESFEGQGEIEKAIYAAAGPELLAECRQIGACRLGQAVITKGYKLPAKHVIHTVGTPWRGGTFGEEEVLESCYQNCLKIARARQLQTIAFSSIATGNLRFPVERAAKVAWRATLKFLKTSPLPEKVSFICFTDEVEASYRALMSQTKAL
ncbi:MAG: macro domain-containing protein [Dongiaceae bacterium]